MGLSYKVERNKVMMSKEAKSLRWRTEKKFTANESVMIAQYQGLNVNELDALRKELREKVFYLKLLKTELLRLL